MGDYLILLAGLAAAAIGGELFVRGAVGLAKWARVPAGIIAATIAAFATSSPELAVSVGSALEGTPQIALGDALGSNVVNIAVILSVALAFSAINAPKDTVKRDFPVALLAPILTGILLIDGEISRLDGAVMLLVFAAWIVAVVLEVRKQRASFEHLPATKGKALILISAFGGLACLVLAGHLIVTGAKSIALSYGLDAFIVGATVVAVGTSMPELATVIISKLRGHEEIGLGMILGSNIFNNLWIVAVAALITPMTGLPVGEVAVGLGFGVVTVALTFPGRDGIIGRTRGLILFALYIAYLITILGYR